MNPRGSDRLAVIPGRLPPRERPPAALAAYMRLWPARDGPTSHRTRSSLMRDLRIPSPVAAGRMTRSVTFGLREHPDALGPCTMRRQDYEAEHA